MTNNWFTVESIDPKTFAISEYRHWERTHSNLLVGRGGAILIDSGLGVGNIAAVVTDLTDQPVTALTTDVHWDHIGGHDKFDDIGVHHDEADWLRHGIPVSEDVLRDSLLSQPFNAPPGFDPMKWAPPQVEPTRLLVDRDEVAVGGRHMKVLHTPGHSPGHLCFLEQTRGFLFTGDLIYRGTLLANFPSTDPLAYDKSIQSLSSLHGLTALLPGHNETPLDPSYLPSTRRLFEHLRSRNLLRHGAGEHSHAGLSIRV